LATSGDDGSVRFWDIRNSKLPISIRSDHSHWVWSVKFNQFHDQVRFSIKSIKLPFVGLLKSSIKVFTNYNVLELKADIINPFYFQLLLTSSSDGRVVLSCMMSISSEQNQAFNIEDDDDYGGERKMPLEDGVIRV
jgi:WD40 repeat protein